MMSVEEIKGLLRPNIRSLKAYSSARHEYTGPASVFLDANESPYNSPLNRYPDPTQVELKVRLARLLDTEPSGIFLGNGSDEGIDLLIRSFCVPGEDSILIPEPTYGMYQVCADINQVEVRKVGLKPDFNLNTEGMMEEAAAESCKLIFLCSPNNPSGNLLEKEALIRLLEKSGSIVVLDEAYVDFSSREGQLELMQDYPNLVILRTLSKAWGLAGIRLGMVLAIPEVIEVLSAVKYPYNLNSLTQEYALDFLQKHAERKEEWVRSILEERKILEAELEDSDLVEQVFPSEANFLLVRFRDSEQVFNSLKEKGIIVRDRSSQLHCENCLRITVGTPQENLELLKTLKQLKA